MRTELLQTNHRNIYENFYAHHDRVFSIPLCQNRCGDRDPNYQGLNIKQKIPLRVYIGIKRNNQPGVITFGKLTFYNHSSKQFEVKKITDHLPYADELHEILVKELGIDHVGYELNRLAESSRGVGLGFDGIIMASIATAIGSIQDQEIEDHHDQIIELGIELEEKLFYKHSNTHISASMTDGKYPLINLEYSKIISIEECASEKMIPKIGVDFGLIYSSSPVASEQIGTKSNLIRDYHQKYIKFFSHSSKEALKGSSELELFDLGYSNAKLSISKELVFGLISCYLHKQTDTDTGYLLLTLNRYRYLQTIQCIICNQFAKLINPLAIALSSKGLIPGLTYNDGSSSGGCVMFALPKEQLRSTLYEFLEQPAQIEAGVCMIYSNREDGIETEGLKVEQDLSRGIYSKHIASHNYKLTKLGGECIIGDHNQLIKNCGLDIIFDKVDNKVYLMGIQATSAQLFSQTATVELFDILIHHHSKRVSNKELPSSAYSKSRNEMYGKIIGPFIHVVHDMCNKSLDLEMKGVGSVYNIKFGSGNLSFGIIDERKQAKSKISHKNITL